MHAKHPQSLSDIDQSRSVQFQQGNCCSAFWSQSEHLGKIIAPPEMLVPLIHSGIEKSDLLIGFRIGPFYVRPLVGVAAIASECQVVQIIGSPQMRWYDVFDVEGIVGEVKREFAVFTASLCSLPNETDLEGGKSFLRHGSALGSFLPPTAARICPSVLPVRPAAQSARHFFPPTSG